METHNDVCVREQSRVIKTCLQLTQSKEDEKNKNDFYKLERVRKIDGMRQAENPRGQNPNARFCQHGIDSSEAALFQCLCDEAEGGKERCMKSRKRETAGETKM